MAARKGASAAGEGGGEGVGAWREEGVGAAATAAAAAAVKADRAAPAGDFDAITIVVGAEVSLPLRTVLLRFAAPPRAWLCSFSYRMR